MLILIINIIHILYTCRHIKAMIIWAMHVCFVFVFRVKCDLTYFRDTKALKLTEACFLCIFLLKRLFFGQALGPGQRYTQQPCKYWTQAEKNNKKHQTNSERSSSPEHFYPVSSTWACCQPESKTVKSKENEKAFLSFLLEWWVRQTDLGIGVWCPGSNMFIVCKV